MVIEDIEVLVLKEASYRTKEKSLSSARNVQFLLDVYGQGFKPPMSVVVFGTQSPKQIAVLSPPIA